MAISYLATTLPVLLVDDHVANAAGDIARAALGGGDDTHDDVDAAVGRARQVVDGFDGQSLSGDEFDRRPAFDGVEQAGELLAVKADAELARGRGFREFVLAAQELE